MSYNFPQNYKIFLFQQKTNRCLQKFHRSYLVYRFYRKNYKYNMKFVLAVWIKITNFAPDMRSRWRDIAARECCDFY